MFGCLRKLGCLFVMAIAVAVLLFFTRDRWGPYYRRVAGGGERDSAAPALTEEQWRPLSDTGATRARRAIESLGARGGPVYVNVSAADLTSYVFTQLTRQLPAGAEGARAAVVGDRLYLKALVSAQDLGGSEALGPLGGLLPERDTVTFGGNLEMVRPELAQFRVRELRYGELSVPRALIPQLVRRSARNRPEGLAPDALPLPVPPTVADVRVARGTVTLYRNASQPSAP